jgi:hypothetical protein
MNSFLLILESNICIVFNILYTKILMRHKKSKLNYPKNNLKKTFFVSVLVTLERGLFYY